VRALAAFAVLALAGIGAGRSTANQLRGRYPTWPAWLVGLGPLAAVIVLAGWLIPVLGALAVLAGLFVLASWTGRRMRTVRRRDSRPVQPMTRAHALADRPDIDISEVIAAAEAQASYREPYPSRPDPAWTHWQ
jgi:hypothetical protein